MIYLQEEQLKTSIALGKSVEQWLGTQIQADFTIIKWLRIDKEADNSYTVSYFECFDDGSEDFYDVYEFSSLDPDQPFGLISSFSSVEDAIIYSTEHYGASSAKFIIGGMIQEEYAAYLKNK